MATRAPKVTRVSATEAKTHFGELIRRVKVGKDYLDLHDESLKAQIRQGYREYQAGKTRSVEKVLAEVRTTTKQPK